MSKQFHITLLSNDSTHKFPKNVLSSFTNYIESPLQFFGSWEVGISEIFYNDFTPAYEENVVEVDEPGVLKVSYDTDEKDKNTNQFYDMLYIHTDFITPRVVGDQLVRCLKVMPAKGKQQEYIRFGQIEYYPVELFYIRSISISILDSESNRINFNQSLLPTMITLHFRKISI